MEIYGQDRVQKPQSSNQLDCFAYRVLYFWNKFPNLIKNRNSVKKISD